MANLGLLMWNESTKDEAIIGHEVEFSLAVRGTPLVLFSWLVMLLANLGHGLL